ncbi:molybdopterin biosynthesis protein [Novosphingobium sp. Leaf2]|nr:molybdopterin biosynthesis protein [Novosphingobium sp. Leaf2]
MSGNPLLSLEDAQQRLLDLTTPLPIEHVDIDRAFNRYLAQPLIASRTQPAADLSAMDGYAVHADDLQGPWRVVGESAAGHAFEGIFGMGEAIRISTGAVLPEGADAVILQEDLARNGNDLVLTGTPPDPADKHIRRRGMDFAHGTTVLSAGTHLGAAQVGLGLAAGHRHIAVRRRARICIIDSGDELAIDPLACAPHQIPASNGIMLGAMARTLDVDVQRLGPVPDTLDSLLAAFDAAADADLIVTSGGASGGDHDLVRPALDVWGAQIDFWRIAIRPGKPLLVATRDHQGRRQVVIGLPGNPVSGFVTGYFFMLPAIRALLGAATPRPASLQSRLAAPVKTNGNRRQFIRAYWNGVDVVPHPQQDSGALLSLSQSNVLIDRPAHAPAGAPGDTVSIFLLQNGGIA